jgi:hypothetical protein
VPRRFLVPLSLLAASLTASLATFVPLSAWADNAKASNDRVEPLLALAEKHRAAKRYQDAIIPLRAAWGIERRADIACKRGMVASLLGLTREAAEFLDRCLRTPPPDQSAEQALLVETELVMVRQSVASVAVSVNVPGAEILIDGRALGRAPLPAPLFLEPGEHVILAEVAGRAAAEALTLGAGDARSVRLHIGPPFTEMTAGASQSASSPKPFNLTPLVVVGAVVTAAGLGTMVGALVHSSALYDEAYAARSRAYEKIYVGGCAVPWRPPECDEYARLANEASTREDIAIAAGVVAGVAGAATLAIAIVNASRPKPPVSAWISPRGSGIVFTW